MDGIKTPTTYAFRMDAWTPQTIPMKRLAEYLEKLAALFGDAESVHFQKMVKGSAIARVVIDETKALVIRDRLRTGGKASNSLKESAANDAAYQFERIYNSINLMLRDDNCIGTLREVGKGGAKILEFPGRKTSLSEEVVLHENGTLDGVVTRVGGKPPTIPVHIESDDGRVYKCVSNKEVARQLGHYLFAGEIRVSGKGKWRRTREGVWELDEFKISSFEQLSSASLIEAVDELRKIEGSRWNEFDDPHAELEQRRKD